ncbi:MAG TPA: hypothetical protein VFT72_04230 [Opitutaceae bacterium]|nr:hypothetical protein [Opitutaceae bacterium]
MASTKNYLIAFLTLTTAAGAYYAWQQHQQIAALRAEFDQANAAKDADWAKRLAAAQNHTRDLESQLTKAKAQAENEVALDPGAPPPPPAGALRGGRGGPAARFMALMDDPAFSKLWMAEQRGQLDNRYAALFRNLKLSPAELEKFKNLLVEKQNSFRDVMAAARAQGIDPRDNRDQFRALVAQTNSEIDNNIESTLGSAAYQQYKQYEQTLPVRNVVDQLDQRLSYSNTPLNDAQADQLVQVLAQAMPNKNGSDSSPFRNNGRVNLTDQAIAQASSVLTPDQVNTLKQIQSEQQAQRQMQQLIRQGRTAPGGSAPIVGGGGAAPAPRPPSG